jgi:hypothetical protein
MGQLSFATDRPAIVASRKDNVVPFDGLRRSSRAREALAARPSAPEGVVVYLPAANRQSIVNAQAKPSDDSGQRFTPFDYVATVVLILSVFAAPALVWTLLRSTSFG